MDVGEIGRRTDGWRDAVSSAKRGSYPGRQLRVRHDQRGSRVVDERAEGSEVLAFVELRRREREHGRDDVAQHRSEEGGVEVERVLQDDDDAILTLYAESCERSRPGGGAANALF